jgi:hypothetical protein
VNQLKRDSLQIAESFDALCAGDVAEMSELLAESATIYFFGFFGFFIFLPNRAKMVIRASRSSISSRLCRFIYRHRELPRFGVARMPKLPCVIAAVVAHTNFET